MQIHQIHFFTAISEPAPIAAVSEPVITPLIPDAIELLTISLAEEFSEYGSRLFNPPVIIVPANAPTPLPKIVVLTVFEQAA